MCHIEAPGGGTTAPVRRERFELAFEGERQPAFLAAPVEGDGPPVLVIHDIWGTSPFYEDLAARLAAEGFTALLPNFFFRDDSEVPHHAYPLAFARRDRLDQHRTLRELSAAIDWLAARTGRQGRRVGTIGFCLGGTFGLDLAAERDDLATVCYYGFPAGDSGQTPLTAPTPLSVTDRINGPLIGFWGAEDKVCGIPHVEQLGELIAARGVAYEQFIYPNVGHAFMAATEGPAYEAVQDSWRRTLGFLREHVR
jgi:carboxymethylenebutenolidase